MNKKVLCFVILSLNVMALQAYAKASDEVENYTCSEKEDHRIYCVYQDTNKPVSGKIKRHNGDNYASIENFSKGYRDGLNSFFDTDGNIKERSYYKQGVKNGIEKIYYSNRSIRSTANYKNGLLHGNADIYTEDGKLLGRMRYSYGKLARGYCRKNKEKEDFSPEFIKNHNENELVTCGAQ